jgi:peptidoglycan/xylan/chitin deacetylase (PgdA/CDA1 family)
MQPFASGVASVLMLHRFTETAAERGHQVSLLREQLATLRRKRYRLIPLSQLLVELDEPGRRLPPTVIFTVDDGYADFAALAAPVFAEFDCPVTVFLVTGFVDGADWLWWDRVRCAFERGKRKTCVVAAGGETLSYRWETTTDARTCASDLAVRLERVDDAERRAVVDALPAALEADVPERPTHEYAPLRWDDVRALGRGGNVTFGPHTVSHPILAQSTSDALDFEIAESWRRVREETDACTPIFCYPNGQDYAVGEREHAAVAGSGLTGAVTTVPTYARAASRDSESWRYRVPRFACPEEHLAFWSIVSGIERIKAPIRRLIRG